MRVWEDASAPSIHGLWEGGSPAAGYEASAPDIQQAAPQPTGGRGADHAVALPLKRPVASSVQLERSEDWWRLAVPPDPVQALTLTFPDAALPEFVTRLGGAAGDMPLTRQTTPAGDLILSAVVPPGSYFLQISEPPR